MNLHGIVRGAITAVNPDQSVAVSQSTGYTTSDSGARAPTYNSFPANAQIQAMTGKDLRQLEGVNLQGTLVAMYFFGAVSDIIRASQKGGDLITVPSGVYAGTWLATQNLEQWSDGGPASWCKIAATFQNNS